MPDKSVTEEEQVSKTGIFRRPTFLPEEVRNETPRPTTVPEHYEDGGATTGVLPVVTEGEDQSAERDNDEH